MNIAVIDLARFLKVLSGFVDNYGVSTTESRPRKMSEWRGFKALRSQFGSNPDGQQIPPERSPFEDAGPIKLDLRPKVRKRQFTGIFHSSDFRAVRRGNRHLIVKAAVAAFLLLDIGLVVYFLVH